MLLKNIFTDQYYNSVSQYVCPSIFLSVCLPISLSNNSNSYNEKRCLLGRLVEVFSVVDGRFVEVFSVEVFSVVDGRLLQTRSCFVLQLWVSISFSLHDGEHSIHPPRSSPAKRFERKKNPSSQPSQTLGEVTVHFCITLGFPGRQLESWSQLQRKKYRKEILKRFLQNICWQCFWIKWNVQLNCQLWSCFTVFHWLVILNENYQLIIFIVTIMTLGLSNWISMAYRMEGGSVIDQRWREKVARTRESLFASFHKVLTWGWSGRMNNICKLTLMSWIVSNSMHSC